MPTPVTLTIKADTRSAAEDVRKLNEQVSAAFDAMRESVGRLNAQIAELTFRPENILRGTDQAAKGIRVLSGAASEAEKSLTGLQDTSRGASDGLKSVGGSAGGAGKKLTDLAGTSSAVDAALGDMSKSAGEADAALLSLDEGAASAQKSVSGMGRASASALTRLDSLSAARFDPAGVVAGSDAATEALDRVKIAAAEVRAAVRGAGGGAPIFIGGGGRGGGRRGSGALSEGEDIEPMTFREGVRAGRGAAGDIGGAAAMVTTILAAVTGKMRIDFDNMIQQTANSTSAKAEDMARGTLKVGRETGSDYKETAQAYRHISDYPNLTKTPADVEQILLPAAKAAVSQGSNPENTGQLLARTMNEYKKLPGQAQATMNTLLQASKMGDMNLAQFDNSAGPVMAMGKANNLKLPDVLSPYIALSQRYNPSQAKTYTIALADKLQHPSDKALKEAEALKGKTGIDVPSLMTPESFQKLGFVGTLNALAPAIKGDGATATSLVPSTRGGQALAVLTKSGLPDMNTIHNDPSRGLAATDAGKVNPVGEDYAKEMQKTAQQAKLLKNEIIADAYEVGAKFGPLFAAGIPVIRSFVGVLKTLLDGFAGLPRPVQEAILAVGSLKIISSFLPMLGAFSLVSEKTTMVLGGLAKAFVGGGEAAEIGAAGMAGIAVPLAVAAAGAALFALAWSSDFGHIREVTAKVSAEVAGFVNSQFGQVKKWFTQNMPLIREAVHTALAFIQQFWHDHGSRIMAIIGPLWDFIKQAFSLALRLIENIVKLALDVITGHWGAAAKDVGAIVADLWKLLESVFVNGGKMIGNTLMLALSVVYDFGNRLQTALLNAGEHAMDGLVNGIKGGIGRVTAAVGEVARAVPSVVTNLLDIHSPSRVMQKLGLNTAEGLAQGIRDGKISVEQASRLLANTPAAIVRNAIAETRRGQAAGRRQAAAVHSAGEYAATVGESPEAKELHKIAEERAKGLLSAQQYEDAYAQIKSNANKKSETAAQRHAETLAQIRDGLSAYAKNPETPSLNKQEMTAHSQYRRQIRDLGGDEYGPQPAAIEAGMKDAGKLLQDKLQSIQQQRDAKAETEKAKARTEAEAAQNEADSAAKQAAQTTVQLNRELWQHAGGDMSKYFASLVTEADDALKSVTDKFGPLSAHPNAAAVQSATDQHDAQIAVIAQQQKDAETSLADARQEHDLAQGKISLAGYIEYLTKRRDAYQQYSQEWLDLDSRIYSADEEMQRKQLQSIQDLFQAHKISLDAYKKMLADLAAQVPAASSVHQDVVSAANGAENKARRGEMVGGEDYWNDMAGSASEQGSKVLTALLHPKDKKKIFQSLWADLFSSLEGGVTGQFSKMLKNLLTGDGGFSIGGLFGGLFGKKKKADTEAGITPAGAGSSAGSLFSAPDTHFLGGAAGHGLSTSLLGAMPLLSQIHGINGPLGASGKGADGMGAMDIASLAASFIPGGGLFASLLKGGGLSSLFTGGLFGGSLKKLFHFAKGTWSVPGSGTGDTVPAMLTPKEAVIPADNVGPMLAKLAAPTPPMIVMPGFGRSQPAGVSPQGTTTARASSVSAEIHNYGDTHFHYEADTERENRKLAKTLEDALRSGTPA